MGTGPQERIFPPSHSGAFQGRRVLGLPRSDENHQFKRDGLGNYREAVLRGIFGKAASAPRGEVKDAVAYSRTLPGRQLSHRGTIAWDAAQYQRLVELCLARGCSLEDAKELVQEAHLRLYIYQRSAVVRDAGSLLRRIIINLSINHYHRELSTVLLSESIDKLDSRGCLVDSGPGPEQTLAAEQQLDRVVDLVSAMSPRTCQIFIAQRSGYSYEEVAAAFAIKPRTVEKHVTIATSALTEIMPTHFLSSVR